MNRSNQRVTIIVLLSAFLIVATGWSLMTAISHHGKVGVRVVLLPSDSKLTIDGKSARAGTVYFTKTTHTLKAGRQYFTDVTKTINFATFDKSQTIYLQPLPDSYQAKQYLSDHPDIQQQREAADGKQAEQIQNELSKNKLIGLLPYSGPGNEYVVDYRSETQADGVSQKITYYIEADTNQTKQAALDWIKQQGFDPTKLTIVYQGLSSQPTASGYGGGSEYQ